MDSNSERSERHENDLQNKQVHQGCQHEKSYDRRESALRLSCGL